MSATLAKPTHPGLPTAPRRIGLRARAVRHFDATIEAGEELFAFADRLARGFGGGAALLRFSALPLHPVSIHVPEPDPAQRQIMRYGTAYTFDEACELVSGQMSIGIDDGVPVLHCHGHILRRDGRAFGGHLARRGCVVAPGTPPTVVRCTVFDGVRLAPTFDSETGFALLSPVASPAGTHPAPVVAPPSPAAPPADAHRAPVRAEPVAPLEVGAPHFDQRRANGVGASSVEDRNPGPPPTGWMLRFKPDEDLVAATTAFIAAQGASTPRVIGGVGSLMRATLASEDGRITEIDGPGIEIVTLEGKVDALHLVVADLQGGVHAGRPVAGGNPICVTIELFVEAQE